MLDLTASQSALRGTRFAAHLHHFESIGSTNAALLTAAAVGATDGTVYVADEQTAGRGRGGHTWHSEPGAGLYVSALVHLPLPVERALWISLATGLAAQSAIRAATGVAVDIRWPNDLLIGTRKAGGILVETAVDGARMRYAVIGVGINLNHGAFPAELATLATSLRMARGGERVDRQAVFIALLRALDLEITRLEAGDTTLLKRFTEASSSVRGKRVRVGEAGGYTGTTAGLNAAGFLQVREDDGMLRTVLSGGVRTA